MFIHFGVVVIIPATVLTASSASWVQAFASYPNRHLKGSINSENVGTYSLKKLSSPYKDDRFILAISYELIPNSASTLVVVGDQKPPVDH